MQGEAEGQSTRRQFLKGAVAVGTGVAAAAYVKPSLRALGVPGALAQVSGAPPTATPTDSSTTDQNDPSAPLLPLLPSTGGGGTSDSSATTTPTAEPDSDDSHLPELVALAVAGGLIGRRAAQTLRDRAGRDPDNSSQDVSGV